MKETSPIILINERSKAPFSGRTIPSCNPDYHPGFTSATFPSPLPNMKKPVFTSSFPTVLASSGWRCS